MKQLVVERNNPNPILWDTPIPQPGLGEVLIKNHYSVVSSGTELATIDSANRSVGEKLQDSSNITKGLELLEKEGAGLSGMLYSQRIYSQFSLVTAQVEKLSK